MWGVPIDHEMFANINTSQWLWYFHNIMKDQEDEFESNRDMVEYQLSFTEPESIKKIRKAREVNSSTIDSDGFYKNVGKLFGRPIKSSGNDNSSVDNSEMSNIDSIMNKMRDAEYLRKNYDPGLNYKYWATVSLE